MRFTIGIPAFKSAFIEVCITSILNQTFKDFELIIINDASPDPIDEIVSAYNDPRIKYFKNDRNTGAKDVVNNWNKCLQQATGDYFVLMGDDDKFESSYLEEFNSLINKYPDLDIYHCRSKIINHHDEVISREIADTEGDASIREMVERHGLTGELPRTLTWPPQPEK